MAFSSAQWVALPPVPADAVTAGEVATHIVEPGMVLRFEHADPARRAGDYAGGRFPAVERAAAELLHNPLIERIRIDVARRIDAVVNVQPRQAVLRRKHKPHSIVRRLLGPRL